MGQFCKKKKKKKQSSRIFLDINHPLQTLHGEEKHQWHYWSPQAAMTAQCSDQRNGGNVPASPLKAGAAISSLVAALGVEF